MENINYEKGKVLFDILSESYPYKLVQEVQKYLDQGWRLYGPTYERDEYIYVSQCGAMQQKNNLIKAID